MMQKVQPGNCYTYCGLTHKEKEKSPQTSVLGVEKLLQEVESVLDLLRCQVTQVRQVPGKQQPPGAAGVPAAPGRGGVDVPKPRLQPVSTVLHLLVLPLVVHKLNLTH